MIVEDHHECGVVNLASFGETRSCAAEFLFQLSKVISDAQALLLALGLEFPPTSLEKIVEAVGQTFGSLPSMCDLDWYWECRGRIRKIENLSRSLFPLASIENNLRRTFEQHGFSSQSRKICGVIHNLRRIQELIMKINLDVEDTLSEMLDSNPQLTKDALRIVMGMVRSHEISISQPKLMILQSSQVNMPHLSFRNFQNLGMGGWLDDEIINYFVTKWCSDSQTTLGLSSFFASMFIFQETLCIQARTGRLTSEDERQIQRWCRAAEVICYLDLILDLTL